MLGLYKKMREVKAEVSKTCIPPFSQQELQKYPEVDV